MDRELSTGQLVGQILKTRKAPRVLLPAAARAASLFFEIWPAGGLTDSLSILLVHYWCWYIIEYIVLLLWLVFSVFG